MNWSRRFTCPALEQALPELRRKVEAYLKSQRVGEPTVNNIGLLISELTHNAIEAADGGKEVEVGVAAAPQGVQLQVECDANHDLEGLNRALEESGSLPSPESERGRGLWLVLTLSNQLEVTRGKGGAVRVSLVVADGVGS